MPRPAMTFEQTATTRRQLLDVAQRLYEDGGSAGMSFRSIAAAYGCSTTMPYSYFESKADVIDALRIRAYEWIHGVLVMASSNSDDPLDALRDLAEAYVRAGVDRPRMYELLYTQEGAMAETEPRLLDAKVAALGVCESAIRDAASSVPTELTADPATAAHLFWIAAHGLVSLQHGGFLVVGRDIDELLPTLFATMVRGVTANREATETSER